MEDVIAEGSRDAAIFMWGVHNFEFNRVESRNSGSDAYHISRGSSNGKWYDSISRNSKDDGIGFVHYADTGGAHHHTVVRHKVLEQRHGRGFGIIHTNNINFYGPTLVQGSWGAGVIIAREPHYACGGSCTAGAIHDINFYGELRLRRSNGRTTGDEFSKPLPNHGAIHIHNPNTDRAIERVKFHGPVIMSDTGIHSGGSVAHQVRAHGAGRIQAEIADARFYNSGPATKLSASLSSGSSVTTPGWSNSSPYLGAEPQFPLSGAVPNPDPQPTASVSITSPAANQQVGRSIQFAGNHSGMQNVEIFHGTSMLGRAAISGAQWSATIDAAAVPLGAQTFTVRAWDAPPGQSFSQSDSKTVTVQIVDSATPPPPPSPAPGNGDANNDGRVNAIDLSIVLSKDGQNYPAADFNGNGTVDAADMAILLGKWTW